MSDVQKPAPQGGLLSNLTPLHYLAGTGAFGTAGDIIDFALAWVRAGKCPVPSEGQLAAISGVSIIALVPIFIALQKLIIAYIRKITPPGGE